LSKRIAPPRRAFDFPAQGAAMPLDPDAILGLRFDNLAVHYSDADLLLYSLAIGMGQDPHNSQEFPFVFEQPRLRVVPTAASILGGGGTPLIAGAPLDWSGLLHGEHRLTLHRPLPPEADLIGSAYVCDLIDKGRDRGALFTLRTEMRLAGGDPLFTMDNVMFARGDGGFGGTMQGEVQPYRLPDRPPDLIFASPTRADQALLFRIIADRNPLHADPAFAASAGYDRPILHGLCTYGIACRAILAAVCDYDETRIRAFDVRFTAPVFPGERIDTEIWVDGDLISFRCRVAERGVVAIDRGRCLIGPPRSRD
jgi:acyl dehydratase